MENSKFKLLNKDTESYTLTNFDRIIGNGPIYSGRLIYNYALYEVDGNLFNNLSIQDIYSNVF